jgi:uncharacterized protein YjdB
MKKVQFVIFTLITCIFSAFIFASCDTNPRPNYDEPGVVTGVILSLDDLVIAPDESTTLTATVLPADAPDKLVKWTSSHPDIAAVDQYGKVTGIKAGQADITVITIDDNCMAQCAVSVVDPGSGTRVTGVTLNSPSTGITYGKSATLTANVAPDEAANKRVKWTSSDPDIIAVYQDQNSAVTATATAKSGGKADITVSTVDGGKTAKCTITVTFPVPVSGVTLNLDNLYIAPGGSATMIAAVSPADATDKQVKWKSSDNAVATVDANGKVTAKSEVEGTATAVITVTADGNKDATASSNVTVASGGTPVTSVSLDHKTLNLVKNSNNTGALVATLVPSSGATTNFKWISSNTDVATVTWNGNTATVTGNEGGRADITVSTENGGKTDTCVVTVTVPVTGVSLDHTKITIGSNNSTAQLSAAVLPTDATNKNITWSSSDNTVAAVDPNGLVTGKSMGSATVTVTTAEGGYTAECDVTVYGYFDVSSASEWAGALSSISSAQDGSSGNPTVFVINITDSFSTASGGGINGAYKEVRLTGSGTVSLSSNGSLIRTAANQNFIIDGPTLQGKSGNNAALVNIAGGAMELRSGYISGNNNGGFYGGGVYVSGGNFTMTGGTISGNNASGKDGGGTGGGGVCVNGNFTMTGGTISGNNAFGAGGGVRILTGNFTMTDGTIYGSEVDPTLKNFSNTAGAAVADDTKTGGNPKNSTIHKYP